MRGVYGNIRKGLNVMVGSSPHARGLLPRPAGRGRGDGIIPACAGFTAAMRIATLGGRGSSPHARGLRPVSSVMVMVVRIIPACAGFTPRLTPRERGCPDHPRTRGVYAREPGSTGSAFGSSPHARGLPVESAHSATDGRIIPARAGFTPVLFGAGPRRKDHPRTRGVYTNSGVVIGDGEGSSPHARGLPIPASLSRAPTRIIPARAGFTQLTGHLESLKRGSSPHARGLRVDGGLVPDHLRIIPARAGFTPAPHARPPSRPDHPRTRGVYILV